MLIDLHAHFPMHLLVDEQQRTHERARTWLRQRWEGKVVELISRVANYEGPGDTPSVTEALMRSGNVRVALSVLYQPFNEIDLEQRYGAPPLARYFQDIVDQRQTVEDYASAHPAEVAIAHSSDELDSLLRSDVPILIHAIEGGFQIGDTTEEVRANARVLAELGVAYVTVAHLFFRAVATNAPALPFLPDRVYNWAFPQHGEGLTERGCEVVHALVDEGILIDITHMRRQSIADVFSLLDARDPGKQIPVMATHMAYRFGKLEYCFDDATVMRVAERGGVLGCILCDHYITSGLSGIEHSFEGSVEALARHINKIHDLTGGYDHIAIGSDLDGYIKPALPGLQDMSRMAGLQEALRARYGEENAEKICSGNALRILRDAWGRKWPRAPDTRIDL
jgi:microsomal dipeptidase-like Zn-dependent dipeptidase